MAPLGSAPGVPWGPRPTLAPSALSTRVTPVQGRASSPPRYFFERAVLSCAGVSWIERLLPDRPAPFLLKKEDGEFFGPTTLFWLISQVEGEGALILDAPFRSPRSCEAASQVRNKPVPALVPPPRARNCWSP